MVLNVIQGSYVIYVELKEQVLCELLELIIKQID